MLRTDRKDLYDNSEIAEEFNIFFTNIGHKLANKIAKVQKSFDEYLIQSNHHIANDELSFSEFKLSNSLPRNKATEDNINSNIILDSYDEIKYQLYKVFKSSIRDGIFPDRLKIAKVIPVF